MSNDTSDALVDPIWLARAIAECEYLWQMRLLSARGLADLARNDGLPCSEHTIVRLWQLRLLRADLVASAQPLRRTGLRRVGSDERGRTLYADARPLRARPNGWVGATGRLPSRLPEGVELRFHRFRYYVLNELFRVLDLNLAPLLPLYPLAAERRLLRSSLQVVTRCTAGPDFVPLVRSWNRVVALAVATEPCAYTRLFGWMTMPAGMDEDDFLRQRAEHWAALRQFYERTDLQSIEEVRQSLCWAAERLDPNRTVHMVLRLGDLDFRRDIQGRLGASLLLLTMAEMIRRAAEETFDAKLPEEDECATGPRLGETKTDLYGADRILDANRRIVQEYLRSLGLDYSTRVRWYVEGDTELGAAEWVAKRFGSIQLVNLRGNIAYDKGKQVTFRDSLNNDYEAGVFSVVWLDSDKSENVRAVRKAAEDRVLWGRVHISSPDFELGNFTIAELEEVLWQIAVDNGAKPEERAGLANAVAGATSGKDLFAAAGRAVPALFEVQKGREWGKRLMTYAWDHRKPPMDEGSAELKAMIEEVYSILRLRNAEYSSTVRHCEMRQVDRATWALVRRDPGTA